MIKKKKKAPAAQNLIDSLLDEKTPALASAPKSKNTQDDLSNSEPIDLHLGTFELSDDAQIENMRDSSSDEEVENASSDGFRKVITNSGLQPTLLVELDANSMESEGTLDLSLEKVSGIHILDPVARAEKTAMIERTQLAAQEKAARPMSEKATPPPDRPRREPVSVFSLDEENDSNEETPSEDTPSFDGPLASSSALSPESAIFPESRQTEADDLDEKTVRLTSAKPAAAGPKAKAAPIDRATVTEIRPGVRPQAKASSAPSSALFTSAEASLKQSESLRIAQSRISDLESELERLRRENERLTSAGETLKRRTDEMTAKAESAESHARETQKIFEEEKRVLRGQLSQKERENAEMRVHVEEIEGRLESNFKKIRVRERELEHRLEIIKMESTTLIATKDKMILELKRQIDQLSHETEYGKQKSQEVFNQYKAKQETIRRVVRALRIALTILEGDEDNVTPIKKAE